MQILNPHLKFLIQVLNNLSIRAINLINSRNFNLEHLKEELKIYNDYYKFVLSQDLKEEDREYLEEEYEILFSLLA